MQVPLKITFNKMHHSEAIELLIRDKAARLEPYAAHIANCNVIVEAVSRLGENKLYSIIVDVSLLDRNIEARHHPSENYVNEDICTAISDAFAAECRQLVHDLYAHESGVTSQAGVTRGCVTQLFPFEDYGLIATDDGREVYFHRDNMLPEEFDELVIGDRVHFNEQMSDDGPEAISIDMQHRRPH